MSCIAICYIKNPKKKSHRKITEKITSEQKNQETHAMFQAKGVPQGKDLPWNSRFREGRENQGEAVGPSPLQKDG